MPGSIRLFVDQPLRAGESLHATPEQAHYLGHVMRQAAGDTVSLFNGIDGECLARLDSIKRDRAVFTVLHAHRAQTDEITLVLVFAALKRDATDLVVEKATELGATELRPVFTERTNTARLNLDRLRAIARSAAEQCERLTVPRIMEPVPLPDLLASWTGPRLSVALERGGGGWPRASGGPAALLVGPEGGFSPGERALLRRFPFIDPIGLGPRILRAETACIVGLALLQAAAPPQAASLPQLLLP